MKKVFAALCALLLMTASAYGEDLTAMSALSSTSGISSAGGMSSTGSSSDSRTISHARSTTSSTAPYNALSLTLGDNPMSQLVLGGISLNLTVEGGEFTAELISWEDASASADTLILTADAGVSWRFDGQALQKLRDSGITQLVLQAGDNVIVLPTSGFLQGYGYDILKSSGFPDKAFTYAIAGSAITVTANDQSWTLSDGGDISLRGALVGGTELLNGANEASGVKNGE